MSLSYFQDTFIHEDEKLWYRLIHEIYESFQQYEDQLRIVKEKASELRRSIREVDAFIESLTGKVCTTCTNVCCINKHAYADHIDLVYLIALEHPIPTLKPHLNEYDPCQFLSASGCTIERAYRPFRCNWYFCPSLIDYMDKNQGRAMRLFSERMKYIINKRREMAESFVSFLASGKSPL
ncbi:MAG: hypothetical protein D6828_00480 [Nitrospirae bacterium]|nr:MAG: hypothetical protein D6828_00480 [Nitrospirota bacterium]